MYNVKHPRIHLSKVIDYDVKKKTYTITDDMVFDSEEELIDFLARYHYPKYNFAGNEIPGAYKNKYMDCQALTGYSRNSHLYDFVMNKPLKPSNCKEINYDWILYSYIFWFDTKEMPNFDVRNLKDKVERKYKEKKPEWDKDGWLRWNGINVVYMSYAFQDCISLTELDVSNIDTSKVDNMGDMFNDCKNIKSLDVSKWNTENVNSILEKADTRNTMLSMIEDSIDMIIDKYAPDKYVTEGQYQEIRKEISVLIFGIKAPDYSPKSNKKGMDKKKLAEEYIEAAKNRYYEREREWPDIEVFREFERQIILRCIDSKWMQHINDLEILRQNISLVGYGQKDPAIVYKLKAFDMFNKMSDDIKNDAVYTLFSSRLRTAAPKRDTAA